MLPSNSDVSDDSCLKRKVGRFVMKNSTKFSRLSSRDMYHSTTLINYTQKSFAIPECPEFLSSITQLRNLSINTLIYDSAYFSLHLYLATHKQRLIVLRNVILFVKAALCIHIENYSKLFVRHSSDPSNLRWIRYTRDDREWRRRKRKEEQIQETGRNEWLIHESKLLRNGASGCARRGCTWWHVERRGSWEGRVYRCNPLGTRCSANPTLARPFATLPWLPLPLPCLRCCRC